jgi:hypothetical protein
VLKLDWFYDEIDTARIRRAKELSQVKSGFGKLVDNNIASKAIVVLAYANWEGFYNDCVRTYLKFLTERGGRVRDRDWLLLVSALNSDFESVRDRNHSLDARRTFVANLKERIECGFEEIDGRTVEARSNLDFARLSQNYDLLSFDLSSMQNKRIRLDKELVHWRHAVAHGDSPDLSALDMNAHIDFAASLLVLVADRFQSAMLERM